MQKTLSIGGVSFYYRVSYDPQNPTRLLISAQRIDRQIVSLEFDTRTGQLSGLSTNDGRSLYKVALWDGSACYAEQSGADFEDRELVELPPGRWKREEWPTSLVELLLLAPESMNCLACLRKHLSAALSYGKEILNGHGAEAVLDHRADLAGELKNAEDHASQMEGVKYAPRLRELRHQLEEQEWQPTSADLDLIRRMWQSAMGISSCACRKG